MAETASFAAALATYARQANDDLLEKMAVRIRARAVRRCGELLKQFDAKGKRTDREEPSRGAATKFSQRNAAEKAEMSKDQQVTAVRVSNIPEPEFTRQVESETPPTITEITRQRGRGADDNRDYHSEVVDRKPATASLS